MKTPTFLAEGACSLLLPAPAKVNLCLHVLGRRSDGYHEVAMLMQALTLADEVELTVAPGDGLTCSCAGVELAPTEENIALRAARLLLAEAGVRVQVKLRVEKRIPVAAGLGGGSSDAAAVLVGLNRLLRLGWTAQRLRQLGATLGADVPFFVEGGAAWATGIGEILQPVPPLPPLYYLLVNPGIKVSTPWVYRNLALTSFSPKATLPKFFASTEGVVRLLHNTLETVTVPTFPVIAEIKQRLLRQGALGALMSGSGPTVFGLFASRQQAETAAESLRRTSDWRIFLADPVGV